VTATAAALAAQEDGKGQNEAEAEAEARQYAKTLIPMLAQRQLVRGVYEEEFEESLRQCMEGVPGFDALIQSHNQHLEGLRSNRDMHSLVQWLRKGKLDLATRVL
jgi:hypothetical protein